MTLVLVIMLHTLKLYKTLKLMIIPSETNIIYAVIGSVGIIATVTIWLRANTITSKYYNKK